MKQTRDEKLNDIARKAVSYLRKELETAPESEIYSVLKSILNEFGYETTEKENSDPHFHSFEAS